ncbi:UNVERIFIED_CONTAM: Transposon Ty3-G Gag-Pol polyprotein [Sesamum radiatum]|uniref:Transposon Ty3-G Gag-Pol polyprotein n=1 Tax=Sesamum radiatum TaxID=300843 RepID=A0AAW2L0G4_SESRA
MLTRSQSQSKLQHLQDSVSSLLAAVQEIRSTRDSMHESTSAAIAELQSQRPAAAPSFSPVFVCAFRVAVTPYLAPSGSFRGHLVSVLVESGSSHNILHPRVASYLNLQVDSLPHFAVMVGNGASITCSGHCPPITLLIQGHGFDIPFYLLPIHGADVVLGVRWLQTLGLFLSNFSVPSMEFYHKDSLITLTGSPPSSSPLSLSIKFASIFPLLRWLLSMLSPFYPLIFSLTPSDPLASVTHFLEDLLAVLCRFVAVFSPIPSLPPSHHMITVSILPPILLLSTLNCMSMLISDKETMSMLISDMLSDGLIRPSTSPFSSLVLLVKKKDGTWRFCPDYRALNAITIKDRFSIPTIDELIDELQGASKIDLRSGYHQIRMASEDVHKTAFQTIDGHYEFLVMPFGLTNAPSKFQTAMNDLLRPHRFVIVFFDDSLVYSGTWVDHLFHLSVILDLLLSNHFFAKFSKCCFGVSTVDYLGHLISADVIRPDPSKLQLIADWPVPRSLTDL